MALSNVKKVLLGGAMMLGGTAIGANHSENPTMNAYKIAADTILTVAGMGLAGKSLENLSEMERQADKSKTAFWPKHL